MLNVKRLLFIIVLIIGIVFRFTNLDLKVYWWDEVINSIHSAGYEKAEFRAQAKTWKDQDLSIEDLQQYQYPDSGTSSLEVIKALAEQEPQSPPLYYLLSRWWSQLFGFSLTVQRSLSAVISLFAFPSMYWLCWELFGSSLAAEIGVMLLAISPFHLLFAQEVRMYGLWTVTILLTSAALLRAMRLQRTRDWGVYTASLILSLYTFPFSILVAIAQHIYIAIAELTKNSSSNRGIGLTKTKVSSLFINHLIASVFSIIAYVPWIVFLVQVDDSKMAPWRQLTIDFSELLQTWLLQTSLIFIDLNPAYRGIIGGNDIITNFYHPLSFLPIIFIWVIIIYALYFLIAKSPKQISWFIFPLILVTALILGIPDLIFGGIRSTIPRYLIPCYIGIELSIVNLIYRQVNYHYPRKIFRKIGQFILVSLVVTGMISCSLIVNSSSWWIKSFNYQNIPVANIINKSEKPLIISPHDSVNHQHLISISYKLTDQATVRFTDDPYFQQSDRIFSDKFIFNAPPQWLEQIKQEGKYKVKKVYQGKALQDPTLQNNFNLVQIFDYP